MWRGILVEFNDGLLWKRRWILRYPKEEIHCTCICLSYVINYRNNLLLFVSEVRPEYCKWDSGCDEKLGASTTVWCLNYFSLSGCGFGWSVGPQIVLRLKTNRTSNVGLTGCVRSQGFLGDRSSEVGDRVGEVWELVNKEEERELQTVEKGW